MGDTFLKGVAISVWQNSIDSSSQWTAYVSHLWPFKHFGCKTYNGDEHVGHSNNFWDRYEEDIANAARLGSNSFRFSIEWARLMPTPGAIDNVAKQRYDAILDCMERYGLEPNATLHHFVHPLWFERAGAYEKEENIAHFVDWCVRAVQLFGHRIRLWATFNEPTVYTLCGYIAGLHPPGRRLRLLTAGRVLLNMLRAHCAGYSAIKALPRGPSLCVGLVHHHITFVALGKGYLHSLANWVARWSQEFFGWQVMHDWMLTGRFEWRVPLLGVVLQHQHPGGKPPCDWWGINYYSQPVISWLLQPAVFPGQVMTEMNYPIYPEGMHASIMRSKAYGIPIYITETGIPDASDTNRALWIDSYMQQVLRCIKDGVDVRGFYYWTLNDNFEWNVGYTVKFGLYAWEPHGGVDRVMRPGSRMLIRYFRALPEKLSLLREAVHKMRFPPDELLEQEARAHVQEAEEEVEARHALLVTQA